VNWSSRPILLPCFIESKLKPASLNGDLTDFFITGVEWLVVESTLEITKREFASIVRSPSAGDNENTASNAYACRAAASAVAAALNFMAWVHRNGYRPPSGDQLKSCTTIDEETLQLFKSIIEQKATAYERHYVGALSKRLADEIKADRMLESLMRFENTKAGNRWRLKRARGLL